MITLARPKYTLLNVIKMNAFAKYHNVQNVSYFPFQEYKGRKEEKGKMKKNTCMKNDRTLVAIANSYMIHAILI